MSKPQWEKKLHTICGKDVQKAIGFKCGMFLNKNDVDQALKQQREEIVEEIKENLYCIDEVDDNDKGDIIFKSDVIELINKDE